MVFARQAGTTTGSGILPAGAPYLERADGNEGRVDEALLHAWGRVSPYLCSGYERRRLRQFARRVEDRERTIAALPDARLRESADDLRRRLMSDGPTFDDLAMAFALAREAAHRHVGMRHFHVQLLGGAAMMSGALAEMQTGEGKSLTALLPSVAAALMGRPVHIVTVNDYLARRDALQFRPVYQALGVTVGLVEQGLAAQDRQRAYACDVTYCTNKELVFDYLRDRLTLGARRARPRLLVDELFDGEFAGRSRRLLLRGLHFAIVDEADSVLIDEARTPLILSGMQEGAAQEDELYETALDVARRLRPDEDYRILATERTVRMTPQGGRQVAAMTAGRPGLWSIRRARDELVQQALCALHLFRRDMQYIVAGGKVQIVDEYTGRVMPDRSWERGIHQLVEAKEGCAITERRQTLARITYQRFFRRYLHLCGMTGTAMEAAGELRAVYGLRVTPIPTNRPLRRKSLGTQVLPTAHLKWLAVVRSVQAISRTGRATLIGTRSVGASEQVGALLDEAGLRPVILNARQDRQEADIVASAGRVGRVTVATNMAGRGTDIELQAAVKAAGGLHVILTEYHESPRIDRQLFGRAGRQGDPGSYESIVGLDDELFQRFASPRLLRLFGAGAHGAGKVPVAIGHMLRNYSQFAAEWLHAQARRLTLAEDRRFDRMLGFSGRE